MIYLAFVPMNSQTESHKLEAIERAIALEREAQELRSSGNTEKAFNVFDEAASLYRQAGEHLKSALCYSSAATCWNIGTGWQPLRNAASRNELAAEEALKAKNYEYARAHFLEAALLYEKEGDAGKYSACFYNSKRSDEKLQWSLFWEGIKNEGELGMSANWRERIAALGRWLMNQLNCFIWGYGERPFRTFAVGFLLVTCCALLYSISGQIQTAEGVRSISFLEGLYMSVITYTTVGFGDYLPLGWIRVCAILEASLGIFLAPLFLIGLTRRYLRMYR